MTTPAIDPRLLGLLNGGNADYLSSYQATIDPRVLEAYAAGQDIGQFGFQTSTYQPRKQNGGYSEESGMAWTNDGAPLNLLVQQLDSQRSNVFDDKGNFLGLSSGASEGALTLAALTMLAGGAYGALSSGAGAGSAGLSVSAADAAVPAATWGEVSATLPNLGGAGAGVGTAGAAGTLGAASGTASGTLWDAAKAAATGLNSFRQGEIESYSTDGRLPSSAAVDYGDRSGGLLDWFGRNFGRIAGGLAGAASSGDQDLTTSQQKEPWGPAQPFLKDLITQGQGLRHGYEQTPFSQTQQQAYNNQFGLLNAANQMAPQMFAGFGANASGANAYDRNNPRRSLTGSNAQLQWSPGLLAPSFKFGG